MIPVVFHSKLDDPAAWEAALRAHLPQVDFRVDGPPEGVVAALVWKPPAGFFAPFRDLKLVVNLGAGVDSLVGRDDLPPLPIARLNDPGMVALMRSYILWAVTRYARDFHLFERARRAREWRYIHPRPLATHRVTILGLGELGTPAAEALAGMGYAVTGWARSAKAIPGVRCLHGRAGLEQALAETDTLVVLLPLTPDTRGLLGARELALLADDAAVIAVGRGGQVEEAALLAELDAGRLSAYLDVFEKEPLPAGHPLWQHPRVILTPHIAAAPSAPAVARCVLESMERVARGEPPLFPVDRARGY